MLSPVSVVQSSWCLVRGFLATMCCIWTTFNFSLLTFHSDSAFSTHNHSTAPPPADRRNDSLRLRPAPYGGVRYTDCASKTLHLSFSRSREVPSPLSSERREVGMGKAVSESQCGHFVFLVRPRRKRALLPLASFDEQSAAPILL